jgi:hypothetical protein
MKWKTVPNIFISVLFFALKFTFRMALSGEYLLLSSDPFSSLFSFPPVALHKHTLPHTQSKACCFQTYGTCFVSFVSNRFTVAPNVSRLPSNRFLICGQIRRSQCKKKKNTTKLPCLHLLERHAKLDFHNAGGEMTTTVTDPGIAAGARSQQTARATRLFLY